jgi:hypothetical protein
MRNKNQQTHNNESWGSWKLWAYLHEQACRSWGEIPSHYRYVARPVYKLAGGNKYPLFSVPTTFFVMDYLFHQLPAYLFEAYKDEKLSLERQVT